MIFIIFWAIVFYWYIWYLFFGDYKYLNILTTALQIIYTLELDFHFLIILGRLNDSCSPPPPSPTPSSPYPPPSSTPPSPSPSTITFFLSFFATLTFSLSLPHHLRGLTKLCLNSRPLYLHLQPFQVLPPSKPL